MTVLPDFPVQVTREQVAACVEGEPQPFIKAIDKAVSRANALIRPAAAMEMVTVLSRRPGAVTISTGTSRANRPVTEITLETGEPKDIWRHAKKIVVTVVTLGPLLDRQIRQLNRSRDGLAAYLLDCAGIAALRQAGTSVCQWAENQALRRQWGVGGLWGPGGSGHLNDQIQVCRLVPIDAIGVKMDDRGGLSPLKTVSGLIPMGPGYKSKTVGSICRHCTQRDVCNMSHYSLKRISNGNKRTKKRERKHRKAQILGAARTLLFSKGLTGTSINGIAAQVELSVPAIYRYFKNKDEIIFHLCVEGLDLLQTDITLAADAHPDPEQRLEDIAMAYRRFSTTQKEYFTVINHFLSSPKTVLPDHLKHRIDHYGETILMQVVSVIEQGCAGGRLVCEDPRRFSLMFWGSINGIIQLQKIERTIFTGNPHDTLYHHTVTTLINSIRASPG